MAPDGVAHNLPFLVRNHLCGLYQAQGLVPYARSDHDDERPARKRRRLSHCSPNGRPNGHANGVSAPHGITEFCLPDEPGDLQKALSIDVLRIFHRDTPRVKYDKVFSGSVVPFATTTRARCRVTIRSHDDGEDGESQIVFCDSQLCDVKTYKNPVGPGYMARIHLPKPFIVPHEKILIERADDCVFDLADSYTVDLELEGAGDPSWPPSSLVRLHSDADIFSSRPASSRFCVLAAVLDDIFPRSRSLIGLTLRHRDSDLEVPTQLVLDADVRWTTGFSDRLVKQRLEKGVAQTITIFDPDEDPPAVNGRLNGHVNGHPLSNGYHTADGEVTNGHMTNGNGHLNGDVDDLDDEMDGDITPRKSLRARENKVYNLKALSDKAHGRERKRRRMGGHGDDKATEDGCTVLYTLPAEHVQFEGLTCCVCLTRRRTVTELRAHFLCHPRYDFHFEPRPGKGAFVVDVSLSTDEGTSLLHPRIYQLGRPKRFLDLQRFLDGDDSWITSRFGPENDVPVVERNIAAPSRRIQTRPAVVRGDSRPVVPHVKTRLFDPLSKAELVPGADVPKTVCDDDWLIQKHRDHLQDFVDIGASEKEYMKEWDAFNFKHHISSEAYITRAFVSFVTAKAAWLVRSETRMVEFGKHMAVLVARGSIGEQAVQEAMTQITEAKNQRKAASGGSVLSEPVPNPTQDAVNRRSSAGCGVCGKPVLGPQLLACSNKTCGKRLYHIKCVRATAKVSVDDGQWHCNVCARV